MTTEVAEAPPSQRLCEYWREGLCRQGRKCRFLHTEGLGQERQRRGRRQPHGRAGGDASGGTSAARQAGTVVALRLEEDVPGPTRTRASVTSRPVFSTSPVKDGPFGHAPQRVAAALPETPARVDCSSVWQAVFRMQTTMDTLAASRPEMTATTGGVAVWQAVLQMQMDIDAWVRTLSGETATAEVLELRGRLGYLSRFIAVVLRTAAPDVYED